MAEPVLSRALGSRAPSSPASIRGGRVASAALASAALALAAQVALTLATSGDYQPHGAVSGDNAAPALYALAHGRLAAFLARQPLMGLSSLLLRVPAVWASAALGGGSLLAYRLGALACMLPAALLASWVILDGWRAGGRWTGGLAEGRRVGGLAGGRWAGGLAGAAILIGAPTVQALRSGHPEEVLAATLAAAALLAAERRHPAAAGTLAGAAIGAKEWAVIVLVPLALALVGARERRRAAVAGLPLALALALAPALANPGAFERAARALGTSRLATALSVWWPLSVHAARVPAAARLAGTLPVDLDKTTALALALAAAAAALLTLACVAQRRWLRSRGRRIDPMALLCLLAFLRCLADPGPVEYYYVAAVIPLAVWETAVRRRLPVSTLATLAALWLSYHDAASLGPGSESALTLSFGAAALAFLGAQALWVGLPASARSRFSSRDPIPTAG
jgi:hypothetical protein